MTCFWTLGIDFTLMGGVETGFPVSDSSLKVVVGGEETCRLVLKLFAARTLFFRMRMVRNGDKGEEELEN